MIRILDKENCCGCESCVQVCPRHCIKFVKDRQGFGYPKVIESGCIECGLCEKSCPILNAKDNVLPSDVPLFAAYNADARERATSSSGGIFKQLANYVITQKGVVFGAAFDAEWGVTHDYVASVNEIERLKRSKYVQSSIKDNYKKVKSFLKDTRLVLFVGTPCQIAGLKAFLKKDYENLLTVDVVCHGVPSPLVWQKYLVEIKTKTKKENKAEEVEITDISFRTKAPSWRRYHLSFNFRLKRDGIDAIGPDSNFFSSSTYIWNDYYMLSFLKDYANRPSCFCCKFRNGNCDSDMTLADFWCIEKWTDETDFACDKGTSMVMLHSAKGKALFHHLANVKMMPFTLSQAVYGNPAIVQSWSKPKFHDLYFIIVRICSIKYAYLIINNLQKWYCRCIHFYIRLKNKIQL